MIEIYKTGHKNVLKPGVDSTLYSVLKSTPNTTFKGRRYYVRPGKIPRHIWERFQEVKEELQLSNADTLNLLLDLYEDMKKEVITAE